MMKHLSQFLSNAKSRLQLVRTNLSRAFLTEIRPLNPNSWQPKMPKSKRNRIYTLSQTRKKGREAKSGLLQEVRDCVDKYSHIFVYSVENMRNNKLKEVCCECLCVVDLFLIALLC
ncbi:Ribosome assembly factor mrt4 [Geodia barretti]|uniref:Ribosome assembly factor mrt4 n=1 Tax=Geodia barretti TaxID=519541 RepID=A0AA35SMN5_GEOBA|nr:Ribosome assembly factor mrt4 [Geodia barretti]